MAGTGGPYEVRPQIQGNGDGRIPSQPKKWERSPGTPPNRSVCNTKENRLLHQIKHRYTGKVLYECELPDDTPSGLATRAALEKAVIARANLRGSNLRGSDLSDSDLRGSDLSGSNLRDSDLSDSDLSGSDLSGSDLSGSDLSGSNLRGSNLRDSNLRDSNLRDSDLSGSDLSGSDLSGSDLSGSNLRDSDGKQLPRATPEQAIENLDKVREIVLDSQSRLDMDHWHGNDEWKGRTCAEEALCGTTHCLAGWLQVCATEPALKRIEASLAGVLAAPVASKMFYRDDEEALEWLRDRKYVAESAEAERRAAERKAKREAAQGIAP